ncbi:VOC family protein [Paraburkholderia unamae]|uniref:Catechol 2,3-dioxygenase-like lactoylglutathione lyase family enzyme n=1 Tax=Paraburkholderia unamae TaxID=219649 RepID=A0ABX5KUH5_9BURK|nr:VOC family protein [Paraburkholderia unamae]PVX85655.1 catechol 2,3-dioxygenase-like lactoylglutathione lyase family enzyme [Paraburkholderia unamae]
MSERKLPSLALRGVDHTARPTWRLRETVEFYRDKLGLPLIHVISARGWGPETHPDFLHFFFDSGNGSTIAFFYYLGSEEPADRPARAAARPLPDDHIADATHTAWLVDGPEELRAWKLHLEAQGLDVSVETRHEVIESIYVRDPNGYFVEFTHKLRPLTSLDAVDAWLTLQAAMGLEDAARAGGQRLDTVDAVWNRKAALLGEHGVVSDAPVRISVPRVEEFTPLVRAAQRHPGCRVREGREYDLIEAEGPVEFERKVLGFKPALWYGMLTGGVHGRIERFDRDVLRVAPLQA